MVTTMHNRFRDALDIQCACNPSGVARALVRALDSIPGDTAAKCNDPAVKLILFQLSYLVGNTTGAEEMARSSYLTCQNACIEGSTAHDREEAMWQAAHASALPANPHKQFGLGCD